MKIYTRVVLDWDGRVLEEDSFEYEGPLTLATGGGGGGDSGGTQHSYQTAVPWSAQAPYLQDIFASAKREYGSEGPHLYPGQTVAGFQPEEVYGQQYATAAALSQQAPLAGQAGATNQFLMKDVLTADTNPYMAQYAKGAIQPIFEQLGEVTLPQIRSGAVASGQYGGAAQRLNEAMAIDRATQNALNTTAQMYSDAYGQNLEAMQRGVALAPQTAGLMTMPAETLSGVGAQKRGYEQAVMDDLARRYEYYQQLPLNKLAAYQNLVQGQYGGTGTSTSTAEGPKQSTGSKLLGAAGTGLSTYGMLAATPLAPIAPWAAGAMAIASLF